MIQRIAHKALLVFTIVALSGCSSVSVNLWPFDGDKEQNVSRTPAGSTVYACDNSKHLYVRFLEGGAAAWVILPDREFRLNKVAAAAGTRYGNGNAALDIQDGVATLMDGVTATHTGCKIKTAAN